MTQVCYQPTILTGTNKAGKIKCDPDGYYDLNVGAFDAYNSRKAFYTMSSARSHFDSSHDFQRRIKSGALYGEDGHPVYDSRYSRDEWLTRILTVEKGNISHHIRELHLDDTIAKNEDGNPMVVVFARIKPAGAHAQSLADSLENPHENVAFSIRSITEDHVDRRTGTLIKEMRAIVTYDQVTEPGIAIATKYNNPALESLNTSYWSNKDIDQAIKNARSIFGSFESENIIASLESIRPIGDAIAKVDEPVRTELILPSWSKWF